MARQSGLIKIKGTLDNVTFYKSKEGHLAKMKTSIDGARIANDPAFIRTRENGSEFGSSASSGKVMRDALRPVASNAADNKLVSRVTQLMTKIKNLDATSIRGSRNVGVAMALPAAKALLKGFEFNKDALLSSILYKPYAVNTTTGVITITGLIPLNDLVFPDGCNTCKYYRLLCKHQLCNWCFRCKINQRAKFTNQWNCINSYINTNSCTHRYRC
jgi:hypothetical protein